MHRGWIRGRERGAGRGLPSLPSPRPVRHRSSSAEFGHASFGRKTDRGKIGADGGNRVPGFHKALLFIGDDAAAHERSVN